MRLQLLGVRGSRPVPGPEHVRYGGNTSCVVLSHGDAAPCLVLDAGTGLSVLSRLLDPAPFHGTILLSHLHWDHVQGLPFFVAGDRPDARTRLCMPAQGDPVELLERVMSPPHFPIAPSELRGSWTFDGLESGLHHLEGFEVLAVEIPHKGGRTFGYRITSGGSSLAYLPDHGPVAWGDGDDGSGVIHDAALELVDGVDLLLHDAQHTAEEFPAVRHFGHSSVTYAVRLAREAAAKHLVLFHHDPMRTDDLLDVMAAETLGLDISVSVAREGDEFVLP